MKKTVKILTSVFIVSIIALCFSVTAFAASQDGLIVAINSDKTAYTAGETVKITVTAENTNPFKMKDISIEHVLPMELKPLGEVSLQETVSLAANEKVSFEVSLVKEKNSQGKNESNTPNTGDASNPLFYAVLLAASAGVLFFLMKHRKKSVKIFSLFLCLVIAAALPVSAFASENANTKSFEAIKIFTVDGKSYEYKVVVSYPLSSEPSSPDTSVTSTIPETSTTTATPETSTTTATPEIPTTTTMPDTPEIPDPLTIDLTMGKESACFAGLDSKITTHTVTVIGGSGGTRTYEGILLSDLLESFGMTSYVKVEYDTGDRLPGEIGFDGYNDVLLAWSRVDNGSTENPIRICPVKDTVFGNEMIQMVTEITITF